LINNWVGGVPPLEWPNILQLIEVTPAKKVAGALRDWKLQSAATTGIKNVLILVESRATRQ
jgi:hypothetical protein